MKKKRRPPAKPQGMNLAQAKTLEKKVREETIHAEAWALFLQFADNLQHEIIDAAFMAANDKFGMGPGRCVGFGEQIIAYRDEIAKLVNSDYEDDKDLL